MTPDELLADTNRLLRQLFEEREQQKAETKDRLAELKEGRVKRLEESGLKKRLEDLGVPGEGLEGTREDWQARQKEALARSSERLKEHQEREAKFKEELLQEMRIQSDLLREIKEMLGR